MTNRRGRERDFAVLTKRRLAVLAWVGLLVVYGSHFGQAQLPSTINYQGRLSNAGGQLITGTLAMTFAIYDDKNAASPLWTESYAAVQVTKGQFSVDLGSVNPLTSLTFDVKYWLGITVGADPEMNPRKPFTSVGYAVRALRAQNADHSDDSTHAVDADDSVHAVDADDATNANNADYATTAGYADSADTANSALFATSAGTATTATTATSATNAAHATTADTAATATSATNASHATTADSATSASHASTADSATSAGTATSAASAALADEATFALLAEYARSVNVERIAIVASGFRHVDTLPSGVGVYVNPATAMDDRATWCPSPDESSPCLLKIMPGVYNPGPTPLTPAEWIAIEGSGEDITTVRLDSSLHPVDNAEIRSLTLELVAPSTGPAVDIVDDEVRFSHVTIESYPGASSPVVRMNGSGPGPDVPELRDVTVVVTDGIGIEINNGSPVLTDLTVLAQCTSSGNADAIRIQDASPIMTRVTINLEEMGNGETRGIIIQNNSSPVLNDVHIRGQATGGSPGGRLIGVRNQDASPDITDLSVYLTGGEGMDVLGILNEGNSDPILRDVAISIDFLGSICGTEGTIGIHVQSGSVSLSDSTIRSEGGGCSLTYGLLVNGADVTMRGTTIHTGGSNAKGIECQHSTVEMTGSSVRSTGTHGIWTQDDCRFRIDHSVVAGDLDSIRDVSTATATGYYLIGASKFIGNINDGPGHATFQCIASYEESGNSLTELAPDCR